MAISHLLRSAITTLVPQQPGLARSRVCYENLARTGLCPDSVATTSVSFVWRSAASSGAWLSMLLSVVISPSHGRLWWWRGEQQLPVGQVREPRVDLVDPDQYSVAWKSARTATIGSGKLWSSAKSRRTLAPRQVHARAVGDLRPARSRAPPHLLP